MATYGWSSVIAVMAISAAINVFLPTHERLMVYATMIGIMGVGALFMIVWLIIFVATENCSE
jgi:hypothetical protein